MSWLPSLSQHLLVSALALLIYILTTRVGRVRRPPTSAIAWVTGLALLPYLFLPMFLMFGTRKVRAAQPSRRMLPSSELPWAQALTDAFGTPPAGFATVHFHEDGPAARAALWNIIEGAEKTLDVCTFLVGNDELGREVIERLTERARAGVRVRLMIDAAGVWLERPPSLQQLRRAGGHVAYFNSLWALRRRTPRNLRNHRKFVIADDRRLWTGGRNLAAEYFDADAWIDLSCDLSGYAATSAANQFARDWSATSSEGARESASVEAVGAGAVAQFVPSGPDQAEDTIHTLLLAACFHAKSRIIVVTPYFVPDDGLLEALRLAVLRGVELTLVLPERSNHRLADFVRTRALRTLARAGAQIRLIPRMVHAKAVVIDDSPGWCGSANLDSRSLLINFESVLLFYGQREIGWLAAWMDSLAASGARFNAKPPGFVRDIAEGLLLTVAFQI